LHNNYSYVENQNIKLNEPKMDLAEHMIVFLLSF